MVFHYFDKLVRTHQIKESLVLHSKFQSSFSRHRHTILHTVGRGYRIQSGTLTDIIQIPVRYIRRSVQFILNLSQHQQHIGKTKNRPVIFRIITYSHLRIIFPYPAYMLKNSQFTRPGFTQNHFHTLVTCLRFIRINQIFCRTIITTSTPINYRVFARRWSEIIGKRRSQAFTTGKITAYEYHLLIHLIGRTEQICISTARQSAIKQQSISAILLHIFQQYFCLFEHLCDFPIIGKCQIYLSQQRFRCPLVGTSQIFIIILFR